MTASELVSEVRPHVLSSLARLYGRRGPSAKWAMWFAVGNTRNGVITAIIGAVTAPICAFGGYDLQNLSGLQGMMPLPPIALYLCAALLVTNLVTGVLWRSAAHEVSLMELRAEVAAEKMKQTAQSAGTNHGGHYKWMESCS